MTSMNMACRGSSNGADSGNFGVGVAVAVLKTCRGDVGGQAPSILTFTLGWGSAVALV